MSTLTHIQNEPIYRFASTSVLPGGRGHAHSPIPMLSACWPDLPSGLDALIITGDLQGVESATVPVEQRQLSGVAIASELALLAECGLVAPAARTGVVVTGDLYTDTTLNKRGGTGDVQAVWQAFASRFKWVVGVAGNHDLFAGQDRCPLPADLLNAHLLDGESVTLDGVTLAGISGIIGPLHKPWRWERSAFLKTVERLLREPPDLLLLHEAPQSPDGHYHGRPDLTRVLLDLRVPKTVVFGHTHWPRPMVVSGSTTLLNVDARVVYVTRELVGPI